MGKNKRKPVEKRKEEIFFIISQIISESGFSAVSTTEIARRLGVSQPAIYKYFKNKDELIKYFLEQVKENLKKIVRSAEKGKTTEEKLKILYREHLNLIERTKVLPRIVFADEIHLGEDKREKLKDAIFFYRDSIQKIIKEGIEKGEVKKSVDPEIATRFFLGSIISSSLYWMLSGMKYSLSEESDKLSDFLNKILN
ncbi:MAG TPA: TetR/AcrR family transcriptional regulator [Persephonella sp.]|uniref:Putative YsiA n=1 Tax=Persephonella marina (strain DSM 14350 / EX-H1) TaxID=123214 RepID=C0QPQ2_PERMH|nr:MULTISPECIES: TetR/AcrR family transcriptional regulator [Persephonella]ACO03723.1 putative YsiA [Persephonella marina EX-H1]HCB69737.1 TetR/AcrR family transcriptional regulator [Persephonella sp.]